MQFMDATSGRFKELLGDRQLMARWRLTLLFICNVQMNRDIGTATNTMQGQSNSEFGQIGGRRIAREVDPWELEYIKPNHGRYKVESRFQTFFFPSPISLPPHHSLRYTLMLSVTSHTAPLNRLGVAVTL
jgi:hypothetical protein